MSPSLDLPPGPLRSPHTPEATLVTSPSVAYTTCVEDSSTLHHTVGSGEPPTLFVRVGGAPAVAMLVASLYERVRADQELAPYFHRTDLAVQRRKLAEMLTDVLGGPQAPWLLDLQTAHRGHRVSHRHFALLCAHLIDVLEHVGLTGDEADDIIEWVGRARSAVVEE